MAAERSWDEEDSFWSVVHELTLGQLFVDVLVMPLLGAALVALLALIVSASAWATVTLTLSMKAMLSA